jgi:hypothetical protein
LGTHDALRRLVLSYGERKMASQRTRIIFLAIKNVQAPRS